MPHPAAPWKVRPPSEEDPEFAISALYARGPRASLVASYAIWLSRSGDLDWAVLRRALTGTAQLLSYQPVLTATPSSPVTYSMHAFGALHAPDILQLAGATKTHIFLIDQLTQYTDPQARVKITTAEAFVAGNW